MAAYPFGRPETGPISGLQSRGYPSRLREEEEWARLFDWSCLRRLRTENSDLALVILPQLTALQEANLDIIGAGIAGQFYNQIPVLLEAIAVRQLADIGLQNLLRHGSRLRRLQVHNDRFSRGVAQWDETPMGMDELCALRTGCPLLEDLSLAIERGWDIPYEALDVLATFPRLRRLVVFFELVADGNVADPAGPERAVTKMYQRILDGSSRLRTLRAHYGSPPPPATSFGCSFPGPNDPASKGRTFTCTLSDSQEDAQRGLFSTVCKKAERGPRLDEMRLRRIR